MKRQSDMSDIEVQHQLLRTLNGLFFSRYLIVFAREINTFTVCLRLWGAERCFTSSKTLHTVTQWLVTVRTEVLLFPPSSSSGFSVVLHFSLLSVLETSLPVTRNHFCKLLRMIGAVGVIRVDIKLLYFSSSNQHNCDINIDLQAFTYYFNKQGTSCSEAPALKTVPVGTVRVVEVEDFQSST